jgi:putative aminopeptidase FrvX
MPETPPLLDALLRVPAPSGYEEPAAAVWREAAGFAELRTDALGSSVAVVEGAGEGPTLAIVGPTSTTRASSTSCRSAAGTPRSSSASG